MIADAKAGKIDLIITKSVSRFARNVEHFLKAVRSLAEHNPPIGVFFESENIYSFPELSYQSFFGLPGIAIIPVSLLLGALCGFR